MKSVFVLCLILLVELISFNSSNVLINVDQFHSKLPISYLTEKFDCDNLIPSQAHEEINTRLFQNIG